MKMLRDTIPWLILMISFVIPAYFYDALPNEIPIVRGFAGGAGVFAEKSLFTVFRVPLIETVCALAVETMRRGYARTEGGFSAMWTVLLYTVSVKSLLQSLEIVSPAGYAGPFFYLTLGVVAAGIIAALFFGRDFFGRALAGKWHLAWPEKSFLALLLCAYLGLAIVPIFVFK